MPLLNLKEWKMVSSIVNQNVPKFNQMVHGRLRLLMIGPCLIFFDEACHERNT